MMIASGNSRLISRHQMQDLAPIPNILTAAVFGDRFDRNEQIDAGLSKSINIQLSMLPPTIKELILAHRIPDSYLDALAMNRIAFKTNMRWLTFYSYKATFERFHRPCEHFANLEDLTFERTDLTPFNLQKCGSLKRLYILNANYFKDYDVSALYFC